MNRVSDILQAIAEYSTANPGMRFCQILYNLDINAFAGPDDSYLLRDNYNDSDTEVLERIQAITNGGNEQLPDLPL